MHVVCNMSRESDGEISHAASSQTKEQNVGGDGGIHRGVRWEAGEHPLVRKRLDSTHKRKEGRSRHP